MGIKGLNKIIKRYAPNVIKEKSIHDYIHSIIAIDSSILLYKYRYASQDSEDSHIHGFVQRVCFYLNKGILPVFVFDGIPPEAKKQTLDRRVKQKTKIENKINVLMDSLSSKGIHTSSINIKDVEQEINKLSKQVTYVTRSHRKECKYLLKLLGIPVIEAHGEAEATCAALQKINEVNYTFTEDTDALTFGASVVLRSAGKLGKVIEVNLQELLESLELDMDQFIDFCILCGCDYSPTIPKIGPITSLSLIKEHKNIENIVNTLPDKYNIPEDFNYITARELFKQKIILPEYTLSINDLQFDKLKLFLTNEKNIKQNVFSSIVRRYSQASNKYKTINKNKPQAEKGKITDYFTDPIQNPIQNHQ